MDIMAGMSSNAFFIALVQIVAIDIVLGGDNAIIIALACRNLPKKQKRLGILWGTAGAIALRVILVFFASALMTTPGLRLIGGVLLLWIGIRLLTDQAGNELEGKIAQKGSLLGAIQTIIIADFVMSLDNALAIAAASKGSMFLVVFGLVVSVPIIIGGSAIILKMMERYPFIITLGAGLLGWLGGDLIANDKINATIFPAIILQSPWILAMTGAAIVVGLGSLLAVRR
jgi:YjbE family integral membrane protein